MRVFYFMLYIRPLKTNPFNFANHNTIYLLSAVFIIKYLYDITFISKRYMNECFFFVCDPMIFNFCSKQIASNFFLLKDQRISFGSKVFFAFFSSHQNAQLIKKTFHSVYSNQTNLLSASTSGSWNLTNLESIF